MSEINEIMVEETTEIIEGCVEDAVESKGGFGKAALIVGGGLALASLAVAGIKKLKNKKADQPKKQKTRLRLVRVVEEDVVEVPEEVTETEEN